MRIFPHLPQWLQRTLCFGAVVVFILRYSYSKKFRAKIDATMNQVAGFVPALFKEEAH